MRRAISGEPAVRQTGVAIFRLLVPDTSGGLIDDYEQWFNGPNRLLSFRVPPGHIYVAGTFPIPPDEQIADSTKTPDALRAAYTPRNAPPSDQARWLIDTVCDNVADTHWARMQEHELLYRAADCNVLYLGDAAHGMVPTLGQGATQALEDAANAAALITRRFTDGEGATSRAGSPRSRRCARGACASSWSFRLRRPTPCWKVPIPSRVRRHKNEESFQTRLKALYRDIGLPRDK